LSSVLVEYCFDLVGLYVLMKIVSDHQHRRMIARAEADIRQQREVPVGASLSQFCTE
jgi:hypothetical protein